jgi:hypothetical protein
VRAGRQTKYQRSLPHEWTQRRPRRVLLTNPAATSRSKW